MSFDLESIITDWKVVYGEKRTGKKYGTEFHAIPIQERKELIRLLVQIIQTKGQDKDFFNQNGTKNSIASACFPPIIYDKESRKRGYEAVWRELREVVAETWPDQDVAQASQNVVIPPTKEQASDDVDPVTHTGYWKELDRSTLKNNNAPTTEVDEEAARILGFIKDE